MKLNPAWLQHPAVLRLDKSFARAGHTLRFVGGCVRDSVLGYPSPELDAASDATPEQTIALLEGGGIRVIPTGLAHGTVTARLDEQNIEITTLRKDIATDGRHAQIAYTTSWEEDAARRDFTMNALYLDVHGQLFDPVGGLEDCRTRRVCFIGDANARIREDYLRILRYFRFVATVGMGRFDEGSLAACAANKNGLSGLSGERIRHELLKLLAAEHAGFVLEKLLPILPFSLSLPQGLASCKKLDAREAPPLLKLAALIGTIDALAPISEQLKLSNKQIKSLETWLTGCASLVPGMKELEQKMLVRALGRENYLCALQLAYSRSGEQWEKYAPLVRMAEWRAPDFPLTAQDLLERGYVSGPDLGAALRKAELLWEESDYKLTRDELITRLH